MLGASDDMDAARPQAIAGGSIVIQQNEQMEQDAHLGAIQNETAWSVVSLVSLFLLTLPLCVC